MPVIRSAIHFYRPELYMTLLSLLALCTLIQRTGITDVLCNIKVTSDFVFEFVCLVNKIIYLPNSQTFQT
jgi:hypothetical protein